MKEIELSGMCTKMQSLIKYTLQNHSLCRSTGNEIDLTGFHPSPKKQFTVIFHILIPKSAWGWKDKESYVTLKFGHRRLGNWQRGVGDFKCTR